MKATLLRGCSEHNKETKEWAITGYHRNELDNAMQIV